MTDNCTFLMGQMPADTLTVCMSNAKEDGLLITPPWPDTESAWPPKGLTRLLVVPDWALGIDWVYSDPCAIYRARIERHKSWAKVVIEVARLRAARSSQGSTRVSHSGTHRR